MSSLANSKMVCASSWAGSPPPEFSQSITHGRPVRSITTLSVLKSRWQDGASRRHTNNGRGGVQDLVHVTFEKVEPWSSSSVRRDDQLRPPIVADRFVEPRIDRVRGPRDSMDPS
jgi:hypothetical protein